MADAYIALIQLVVFVAINFWHDGNRKVLIGFYAASLGAIRLKIKGRDTDWNAVTAGCAVWFVHVGATSAKPHMGKLAVKMRIHLRVRVDEDCGSFGVI